MKTKVVNSLALNELYTVVHAVEIDDIVCIFHLHVEICCKRQSRYVEENIANINVRMRHTIGAENIDYLKMYFLSKLLCVQNKT